MIELFQHSMECDKAPTKKNENNRINRVFNFIEEFLLHILITLLSARIKHISNY